MDATLKALQTNAEDEFHKLFGSIQRRVRSLAIRWIFHVVQVAKLNERTYLPQRQKTTFIQPYT